MIYHVNNFCNYMYYCDVSQLFFHKMLTNIVLFRLSCTYLNCLISTFIFIDQFDCFNTDDTILLHYLSTFLTLFKGFYTTKTSRKRQYLLSYFLVQFVRFS